MKRNINFTEDLGEIYFNEAQILRIGKERHVNDIRKARSEEPFPKYQTRSKE